MNTLQVTIFILSASIALYIAAVWLYRKSSMFALLHPVFSCSAVVILVLSCGWVNQEHYAQGAYWLLKLLELAIVALALPIYTSLARLKGRLRSAFFALLVSSVGVAFIGIVPLLFLDIDSQWWRSLVSKSVTTPVAVSISQYIDAWPAIAALAVSFSGALGGMFGPWLLDKIGIKTTAVRGLTQGICSHAFATATLLEKRSPEAQYSALAMGVNALLTALWLPIFISLMGW